MKLQDSKNSAQGSSKTQEGASASEALENLSTNLADLSLEKEKRSHSIMKN